MIDYDPEADEYDLDSDPVGASLDDYPHSYDGWPDDDPYDLDHVDDQYYYDDPDDDPDYVLPPIVPLTRLQQLRWRVRHSLARVSLALHPSYWRKCPHCGLRGYVKGYHFANGESGCGWCCVPF